ncbi:MAG: L,D-transpeptidase family protein [Chloroflexota bacterium]
MKATVLRAMMAVALSVAASIVMTHATFAAGAWQGVVGDGNPNIRSGPSTSASIVGTLSAGIPISIQAWVHGQMVEGVNETWGEIAPGEYVYSANLLRPSPSSPLPAPRTFSGHWIDVNLTQQIITAYDGSTPAFWAVMSSGAPGWETETGVHQVLRRVPNETMTSASLPAAVEVPYDLTNVLYTQYFTSYGEAIHDNYWKGADSPYGVPTSHGCIGLPEPQAKQFWDWAQVGTTVNIHE